MFVTPLYQVISAIF